MTVPNLRKYPRLDGLSLLLIDDDSAIRELLQAALELTGARVTQVSSGAEGLASWEAEQPSVVLSDIAMPEMDGYEFIRALRQIEQDKGKPRTPAVALSAFTERVHHAAAIDAGFDRYVAKPADPADLARLIDDLCRDRGHQQARAPGEQTNDRTT
jgi:CheY-like chemotaxis protein